MEQKQGSLSDKIKGWRISTEQIFRTFANTYKSWTKEQRTSHKSFLVHLSGTHKSLARTKFYLFEMEGVLTSAVGSACTMQASCASLPSPEWTQPLSTSISGASAQQNGLVSQELMRADVHNARSPCGGSTPGLFRIWDPGFCSPRGLKYSATSLNWRLTHYALQLHGKHYKVHCFV
jgi:hypothetical protein